MQFADAQFVAATDHIFTYYTDHHNNLSSEKIINENKNMKTDRSLNRLLIFDHNKTSSFICLFYRLLTFESLAFTVIGIFTD